MFVVFLNSALIAYIIYHFTRRIWFAILAAGVLIFAPVVFRLHLLVISEPLFFGLLVGVFLLARYLEEDRLPLLV